MPAMGFAVTLVLLAGHVAGDGSTPPGDDDFAARRARVQVAQSARIELIRRLTPSVVCIFPKDNRAGGGSGVLIDADGYGLTNYHVVAPLLPSREGEGGLADGNLYPLEVLGLDPVGDVAMFRLKSDSPFHAATLGNSDTLAVGDETLALGNPFLLAEDFTPTVTFGIVSGLHRYQPGAGRALIYSDCIQVDASINPGNSGGPLFDMTGKLIGINGRVSIEERGRINVGVGYAITINQIRRFIPALRAGLTTQHGAAGFTVADGPDGVTVDRIEKDCAAARAGIRVGDRLRQFAGTPIRSANHFLSLLGTYPAGWPVEAVLERGDITIKFRGRLEASPLPRPRGARDGAQRKMPDPFAPIPPDSEANRRAVRRALKLFIEFCGGSDALNRTMKLEWSGRRFNVDLPGNAPIPIERDEEKPPGTADLPPGAAPSDIERMIRWELYGAEPNAPRSPFQVVGSDEVDGRIAVVLELKKHDVHQPRIGLDDETGELLFVEFTHGTQAVRARYEYGEVKRSGTLRLPMRRRIHEDDRLVAEEQYDSAIAVGP
ncbi:MAG: hypothetical protein HBSAPP02_08030 [Phycisphaerae bacterium]|nr:MAG: hypothetical protein HBSAPP02_08030 [Phycisphaerae bacterium]